MKKIALKKWFQKSIFYYFLHLSPQIFKLNNFIFLLRKCDFENTQNSFTEWNKVYLQGPQTQNTEKEAGSLVKCRWFW